MLLSTVTGINHDLLVYPSILIPWHMFAFVIFIQTESSTVKQSPVTSYNVNNQSRPSVTSKQRVTVLNSTVMPSGVTDKRPGIINANHPLSILKKHVFHLLV